MGEFDPSFGSIVGNPDFAQVLEVNRENSSQNDAPIFDMVKLKPKWRSHNFAVEEWPAWRQRMAALSESPVLEFIMSGTILANVFVMVMETNKNATCEGSVCAGPFFRVFSWLCLAIYTLEVLINFAVYRVSVLCDSWSVLDIVVVVLGFVEIITSSAALSHNLPNTSFLKAVRVFRLLRAIKFVQYIPELQGIVRGFVSAMSAMFWGVMTIMSLFFLVSIVTVELVHPVVEQLDFGHGNQEWCTAAFSSVQLTMLFYTQTVIAGDSWGVCIIPVTRYHFGFAFLFTGVTVLIQLGVMNLILTAMVEQANRAHESDVEARVRELHEQDLKHLQVLGDHFAEMDADRSGNISEEEFLHAYDAKPSMQKLFKLLNIDRDKVRPFFRMMDQDRSGTINYDEFLTTLRDAQLTDWRMQLMTVKLQGEVAIRLMEELHGIPKDNSFLMEASGQDMSAREILGNHVKKSADDDIWATPSEAASSAKKGSLSVREIPGDHLKMTLSFADAEDSKSCEAAADAEGLPVVADGCDSALDDLKTFLDAFVAKLDVELRAFPKSLNQKVDHVLAATLSRTAPFNTRVPPPRRDLVGHEWAVDDPGPGRPSPLAPPLKPPCRKAPSRAAPGAEAAAGVSALAEEGDLRCVSATRSPHSIL